MALNLKELKDLREMKVKEMETLIEEKRDNMDEETLSAVKTFKQEIDELDRKIEAVNELRQIASINASPAKKEVNAKEEIRAAFNEYLRGQITERELEKRANTVSANSDVVPEDFLRELFEAIDEFGSLSPDARHITTADNGPLSIPTINDTANAGIWTDEGGNIALQDFSTGTINMGAFKVATGIEISTELLEDSFFSIDSYIAKALGERLARTMEEAYLFGDGTNKPTGIINDTKTVQAVTANAGSVTVDDLTQMIGMIPPTQRVGAQFYVSDDVMLLLADAKDADGRPLLQPSAQATEANDVQYTLRGYPVRANYSLQPVAEGNVVAVFGNPSNYMIRDVRNVTVKRDDYSAMGNDMVRFYATARVDGKTVNANTCFVALSVQTTKAKK